MTTDSWWKLAGMLMCVMLLCFIVSILRMPDHFKHGVYSRLYEIQTYLYQDSSQLRSDMKYQFKKFNKFKSSQLDSQKKIRKQFAYDIEMNRALLRSLEDMVLKEK